MLDFLRAEWKTLIVAVLAALGVYLVFQSQHQPDAKLAQAEATVVPGERLGELELGMPAPAVLARLGEPHTRETAALDLRALRYPERGLTVYTHGDDGPVTAITLSLDAPRTDPLPADLIVPGGRNLVDNWDRASGDLGRRLASLTDADGQSVQRYEGLGVVVEYVDDTSHPVEITLFAPQPDAPR